MLPQERFWRRDHPPSPPPPPLFDSVSIQHPPKKTKKNTQKKRKEGRKSERKSKDPHSTYTIGSTKPPCQCKFCVEVSRVAHQRAVPKPVWGSGCTFGFWLYGMEDERHEGGDGGLGGDAPLDVATCAVRLRFMHCHFCFVDLVLFCVFITRTGTAVDSHVHWWV